MFVTRSPLRDTWSFISLKYAINRRQDIRRQDWYKSECKFLEPLVYQIQWSIFEKNFLHHNEFPKTCILNHSEVGQRLKKDRLGVPFTIYKPPL